MPNDARGITVMRKKDTYKSMKHSQIIKEPIKNLMMIEGKFLHGVWGKPTNGPRGNKKY
jgi:hypothetical protein